MSTTCASMTGFARYNGQFGDYSYVWEMRSVNGRGLDLKLRVPSGWEAIDIPARHRIIKSLVRGNVQINLQVQRQNLSPVVKIDFDRLRGIIEQLRSFGLEMNLPLHGLDSLLTIRGIIETTDDEMPYHETAILHKAVLEGLDRGLAELLAMREREGEALRTLVLHRCVSIKEWVDKCDHHPARQPSYIQQRLAANLAVLVKSALDQTRLYQEALLMAAKADIREELDRLRLHCDAMVELLHKGGAIGRKLDFLSQELHREANTLCAKSNHADITALGLEMRNDIEQIREQVQNIE